MHTILVFFFVHYFWFPVPVNSVIRCLEDTAFVYMLLFSLFIYCLIYFVSYTICFALINDGGAGVVMFPQCPLHRRYQIEKKC